MGAAAATAMGAKAGPRLEGSARRENAAVPLLGSIDLASWAMSLPVLVAWAPLAEALQIVLAVGAAIDERQSF